MRKLLTLAFSLCLATACNKSSAPASSGSSKPPDAIEVKLEEYAGSGPVNCGRFDVKTAPDQLKTASDCAMQASQGKHPFFVAYDMPGMAVGVAGNSSGKLFTVQAEGSGAVTAGDCPAQLRVASSGRVTCFAPGDMGSMSGSHAGGSMPPGTPNPHGGANPPADH
jgi:hypothetical protein